MISLALCDPTAVVATHRRIIGARRVHVAEQAKQDRLGDHDRQAVSTEQRSGYKATCYSRQERTSRAKQHFYRFP